MVAIAYFLLEFFLFSLVTNWGDGVERNLGGHLTKEHAGHKLTAGQTDGIGVASSGHP